jgi:hypothetical protein
VDWNDDGKKDIVTGENNGNIRIYLNTGTDASPAFSGYSLLQVGGSTFDTGDYSWIHVVDWNNDNLLDVLSGEEYGRIYLMLNEGSPGTPLFNSSVLLQDGVATLDVGERSSPTVTDWNGDGKKDLLSGNHSGYIYYYENKGTDANPSFSGWTSLYAGGSLLDVGFDAHPDVADWNNDGVIDILTGNGNGRVLYYEAMGFMSAATTSISASGGQINFALDAGAANGGRSYLLAGSLSGTDPGTLLPGGLATIPLNRDWFTDYILDRLNTTTFTNFWGMLDAAGVADALLNAPPLSSIWVGRTMHFAYALNNPWDFASNAVAIEIVP